tara:strand:- start:133 stop:606 length:474 start_codon:yes stop_codon:yes gene_type:complete
MAVIKKTKEEDKYVENNDILVTHGEEALTFRKDDPRTQEYLDKKKEDNLKQLKESGKNDLWAGISISNTRQDGETYDIYKERLKTVKMLQKLYKTLGREKCKEQFPHGFAYAINISMQNEENSISGTTKEIAKTHQPQPKMTAMVDGKEVPVIINND